MMDSTIPTKPIDVIFALSTESNVQRGVVCLEPGARLSDLMNNGKPFVPIKVIGFDKYHLVNKDFIVTIREKVNG